MDKKALAKFSNFFIRVDIFSDATDAKMVPNKLVSMDMKI